MLTRYLTLAKFGGFGNVRSAGRVQTPTLALVVERERERMAFVPEDYWQIRGMGAAQGAAEDDRFKIAHKTARFTDKDAAETAYGHVDGAKTGNRRRGDQALAQAAAAHAVCDHLAAGCRRSRGHLACAYHAHR